MDTDKVSKSAVRMSFIFVIGIFFIALLYVAYRSDQGDARISENTSSIERNTKIIIDDQKRINDIVREQCVESQEAARSVNEVLDTLIEGAVESTAFTLAEKTTRIARYKAAKVKTPVC